MRFLVDITQTFSRTIEVNSESRDTAWDSVAEMLDEGLLTLDEFDAKDDLNIHVYRDRS